MSRIVVFDLNGLSAGEFTAICPRAWALMGNRSVDDAGSTTITVPATVAVKDWLQPGRAVMITHASLPPWAGVIDTPWKCVQPVQMTL